MLPGCGGGGGGGGGEGGGEDGIPVTMTLSASAESTNTVHLTWNHARNPTGVYGLYLNNVYVDAVSSSNTSFIVSRLKPSTQYCFTIGAVITFLGSVVEVLERSNKACVTTLADLPPAAPTNLSANVISPAKIELAWNAATDDYGVVGYKLYRDEVGIKTVSDESAVDNNLNPETQYCYRVSAYDTIGNESAKSAQACATTAADTTPPNAPQDLVAQVINNTDIKVSWDASTDDGAIREYRVFRDGAFIQDTPNTEIKDINIDVPAQYCYYAIAYDAAGNQSSPSNVACISTGWTLTTVDKNGDVGEHNALALDQSENVHIGYYDGTYIASGQQVDELKYATNVSGNWVTEVVDTNVSSERDVAITIDPGDSVHVSYSSGASDSFNIKYATTTTGSWATESIDNGEGVNTGTYSSITTDSLGHVHVSYGHGELMYSTNNSGAWQSEIVDRSGAVGYFNAIAIDSLNKAHISYYDWTNGDLKYATNSSGSWMIDTIDSVGSVTRSGTTSIAVDSSDRVHISYYDSSNGDLKYATYALGMWMTKVVDSSGDVGRGNSVALDRADKIHISYIGTTNHELRYATNMFDSWDVFIIDNAALIDGETSLCIDVIGKAHISYHGDNNLKYATNR
jgi:hypothetical protein